MKNKVLLVFLAMVLVVSLAALPACKAEEEPPVVEEEEPPVVEEEEPPVVEEVWEWPERLNIAASGTASLGYAVGMAWSAPMAKDTDMRIRLSSEDSSILRFAWVKQGLFFATGHDASIWFMDADGMWANRDGGPFQVRNIFPIGGNESMTRGEAAASSGYAVRGDSGMKTPYDIKPGTKIIYISFAPQGRLVMEALLRWAQVDPADVTWVPAATIAANTQILMDGRGDVAICYPTSPIWYEAEAAPHGLDFIELDEEKDPEGAERFVDAYPGPILFGKFETGVSSAIGKWGAAEIPGGYLTRADSDPELVYHLVKWWDENYDKFKDAHPNCKYMTIPVLMCQAERSWVPIHEGTKRYLKEKGLWTAAHEARWQEQVDIVTKYVEAYEAAIDLADDNGIKVSPDNEEWTELWKRYKKEIGLPPFRNYPAITTK